MREYTHYLYSPSKSFGSKPNFIHRDALAKGGFSSLYAVSPDVAQSLTQAGTTQGFKGVVWNERLWLDFDSYGQAEAAEEKLITMGVDYVAFDSGGRGGHFGILRDHAPSHLLPLKDKLWARTHFPDADPSIYWHLHLFRLPGTRHEKTGRVKALVSSRATGKGIHLPDLAREEVKHVAIIERDDSRSIFDCFRVMANTVPAQNGYRHPTLVKLAYALKQDAGVQPEIAMWWMNEANKLFEEPKSEEEIEGIVKRVWESVE